MPDLTIPSVFISYSHFDRAWRDRIASSLESRGVRVEDDTLLLPGDPWEERLTAMREEAGVAILIVTQNFLASEVIQQNELPHLLQLRDSKHLRLLPVVAETSNWRAVKALHGIQVFPSDGRPLSSSSQGEIARNLEVLSWNVVVILRGLSSTPTTDLEAPAYGSALESQPKPLEWLDQEAISRFSDEVLDILGHADRLRTRRGAQCVNTRDVLVALRARPGSQLAEMLREAKSSLEELIGSDQSGVEVAAVEGSFKGFPPMSPNVGRALVRARDQADESRSESITASHLLHGVLSVSENPVVAALNQLGITPDRVQPPFKVQAKPSRKPLAGYQSDDPTGDDLLEIGKEVEDLASVLAAKDVDPPLSLGLFGDWGSGKSFFMRQLERRIDRLQQDAREAQGDSAFCQDIVQLTFNAWNYIDTDLWASLAAEIFEGLAAAIARKRGNDSQDERALVLAAASSSEAVLTEAERRKHEAETELAQNEENLARLREKESGIEARLSAVEVLKQASRIALEQQDVKDRVAEAAKELHIPEAKAAVAEIGEEILALHGIVSTTVLAIRRHRHPWIWVTALGAVLVAAAAWFAPMLLPISRVGKLVAQVVGMLATVSVFLSPFVNWARKAQRFIDKARAAKEKLDEEERATRRKAVETEHDMIKQRVEQARKDVAAASERLTNLDKQLERMLTDRRIADYIRQRHESSDYTRHLGVIARVRGDFMHLSTLLRDVRRESEATTELEKGMLKRLAERGHRAAVMFPRIDRIILYIDDLDRCPEKNVVEVLQAVHLLLAFPLFVVVVGVDPRWLLHSLQKHSAAFQAQLDETGEVPSEDDLHWRSTPLNYLEKIFQIPFTLRPIDRTGFARMVDSFATGRSSPPYSVGGPDVSRPSGATPSAPPAASAGPAKEKIATPVAAPAAEPQAATSTEAGARPPIESIDRHPAHLLIEEWERGFMKKLHELIPSPRAGKRFINIYRLLRATVSDQERDRFVGDEEIGEYQCALLLLAILTGYPTEATEILRALIEEEHLETWQEFIAAFKDATAGQIRLASTGETSTTKAQARKQRGARAAAESAEDPRRKAQVAELERALDLVAKLERLDGQFGVRACTDFRRWAARVARYSFQSGRVLLHQRPA